MITNLQNALTILVSALFLSACASNVVISSQHIDRRYEPSEIGRVTRNGEAVPVIISGEPFSGEQPALEAAVIEAMSGRNFGPVVAFAIDPSNPAQRNTRVVLVFNPERNVLPNALCGNTVRKGTASAGGEVSVNAALCQGGSAMTGANARAVDVDGPQSANFRSMITQLTQALFPAQNPQRLRSNSRI